MGALDALSVKYTEERADFWASTLDVVPDLPRIYEEITYAPRPSVYEPTQRTAYLTSSTIY